MTSTIPKLIPHNQLKYHSPTAKKNCYGCDISAIRRDPVQLQHQVPEKIPEGSAADTSWGSGGLVPVQSEDTCWGSGGFCAVPEGSVADTLWGSGSFRCRYSVRFRRVTVQLPDEVAEGLGEDAWWGSGGFRGRYLVRFRKVPVQRPCEVPEGFGGEDAWWGSGGFRCRYLVRLRRVLVQMLLWNSKGFRYFFMA